MCMALCIAIMNIIALLTVEERMIWFMIFYPASLFLTHCSYLLWWHLKLKKNRRNNQYLGHSYIPPKAFYRDGSGTSFRTLNSSNIAGVVLVYCILSAAMISLLIMIIAWLSS